MKKKRQRFAENETFPHLFQPKVTYPHIDHELKGRWNELFFQNNNPIILELGCGRGEYTVNMASLFPDTNFIGVDRKGARLWRGAKTSHENNMKNTAFLRIHIQNIGHYFGHDEVSGIWITFPDPQPQTGRERKRLTSDRFLSVYKSFLKPGGFIYLKTDNKPLYDYTLDVVQKNNHTIYTATDDLYASPPTPLQRRGELETLNIKTTYEKIFLEKGSAICYLKFGLNPSSSPEIIGTSPKEKGEKQKESAEILSDEEAK